MMHAALLVIVLGALSLALAVDIGSARGLAALALE
jgi:hypothetical protein